MMQPSKPVHDVERFRNYLRVQARSRLDAQLRGKLDVSGVVQQTMLEAHKVLSQTEGMNEAQLLGWLRRILVNNMMDETRRLRRQKNDAGRERPLEADRGNSSGQKAWLRSDQSSPSQRVVKNEQLDRMTRALAHLPEAQGEAIRLHHLQQQSLARVAEHLGRSQLAVAGLLHRGMMKLRELMAESSIT
jgi:RNA polymerase sigma-70 factor (ECF subfamily)